VNASEKLIKHGTGNAFCTLACFSSSTYVSLHKKVSVLYTQGFWDGELGSDLVYFPPLLTPQVRCDIAAIQTSHNFYMNGSHWQVWYRRRAHPIWLV